MDLSKLTQKAQEALHAAQVKALRYGHQEVDGEHLFLVLLEQADGLVPQLIERLNVPVATVKSRLEAELERRPHVLPSVLIVFSSRQEMRQPG
jgi:ATP-dependent Clp protease ATP-binding subunit ClpB